MATVRHAAGAPRRLSNPSVFWCELSPSLRASLPMLHASVAKPGSQFAGMSLENFERLVETNEKIRASFEAFVAEQVPPPPPPPPAAPSRGRRVKLALVLPANIFFFDSDAKARNTVYNWSSRATGGLVATYALVRYCATFCELDVLAIDDLVDRQHLYGPRGEPQVDSWEGIKVVRAPKRGLADALDALSRKNPGVVTAATVAEEDAAAEIFKRSAGTGSDDDDDDDDDDAASGLSAEGRRLGLMNEAWDCCIATQMEHVKFALEHVPARRKFCPVHDHHSLPYGVWPPCVAAAETDATVRGECAESARDFLRCTLLCTSDYVRRAVEAHGPRGQRAVTCYGADYAAYGGRDPPSYDLSRAPTFGGRALDAGLTRELYRATGRDAPDSAQTNVFVTLISPCAAKGAAVVADVARRCPDVPFLCVSTRWTRDTEAEVAALKRLPNVTFAGGVPSERMDAHVWRRTKVLLAPSIWPEPFGLVAVEAALRGIPVLSTDLAGLGEANVTGQRFRCPLLMDIHCQKTFAAVDDRDPVAAFEALDDAQRRDLRAGGAAGPLGPATPADVARAAAPFVAELRRLVDDPTALAAAADRARTAAKAHVADRQHTLAGQLRAVDPTRPPWVRVPVAGVGGPDKQPGAEALAANLARQCGVISG